ncbi:hypothetical protein J4416_03490 [Candidatus Pacearchaeota archaeon]|nr:hypothetical protein [Candidatus Pacearchaeota archaeon]
MISLSQVTFWFAIVNVILLLYLAVVHVRMAHSIKSSFTIGLLLFVFVFLIHNVLVAYFYLKMMNLYSPGTEIPVLVITLIETFAFSIFSWITRQ